MTIFIFFENFYFCSYSNGDQNGAYAEKDLLNALYKEKAKSEYFEHQSKALEQQANEAQKVQEFESSY